MPGAGAVGPGISFSFSPDTRKFVIAFEDWAQELEDWRAAWTDVRRLFQSHERQHFESEGVTTGPKFPRLMGRSYWRRDNKTYAKWKADNYPGLPILQREKVLFRALVEGGSGALFKRNRQSMELGIKPSAGVSTKVAGNYNLYDMAMGHQLGKGNAYAGANKKRRPPVRFGRDASDKTSFAWALSQIIQAHIVLARRRALKPEIEAAFGKAHAESEGAARKTIEKMVKGTWR